MKTTIQYTQWPITAVQLETATIATFHIGRGGRFYNGGHLSFCDLKPISNYTDDLFITFEYASKVSEQIGDRSNLRALFEEAIGDGPESVEARARLVELGLDLGEECYMDAAGHLVGLSVDEAKSGTGRIDVDGQYDTTYSCYLHDCNESEAKLILEAADNWLYITPYDESILKRIAGIEEEVEEEG